MKKHKFIIRITEENFTELRKMANNELKSINHFINGIIEIHVNKNRKSDITRKNEDKMLKNNKQI